MAKKKKLSKKEKKRLAEEEALRIAQEEEEERLRRKKDEQRRKLKELKEATEQAEKEVREQSIRSALLNKSCELFHRMAKQELENKVNLRKKKNWRLYLKCDGLPNPMIVSEMNIFLFLWRLETDSTFIESAKKKTITIISLLETLNYLIDNPLNAPLRLVADWKDVREEYRSELQKRINLACFHLVEIIKKYLKRKEAVDLETHVYNDTFQHFYLGLWTWMKIPRAYDDCRPPPIVEFLDCKVSLKLPPPFNIEHIVVRALHLKYDHFSDTCHSWVSPCLPQLFRCNINEYTLYQWNEREKYYDQIIEEEENARRIAADKKKKKLKPWQLPTPNEVDQTDLPPQVEPKQEEVQGEENENPAEVQEQNPELQTESSREQVEELEDDESKLSVVGSINIAASKLQQAPLTNRIAARIVTENEEAQFDQLNEILNMNVDEFELNMRKFIVLGGVFQFDFIQQPIQPVTQPDKSILSTLIGKATITPVEYFEQYEPLTGIPENEDEQEEFEQMRNVSFAKLVAIDITLPEYVLWFEPPTAVQWDYEQRYWSKEHVVDPKFDIDKQVLSFRTGKMGPVGLATFRYVNLPYKTWELRPDWKGPPGALFFSITTKSIIVEFIIRTNEMCLNSLQIATSTDFEEFEEVIGTFYKPQHLIHLMRQAGIDIFPQQDAYLYVDGITAKHVVAEDHLYHCMAAVSSCYNFKWSRWNLPAGRNSIVMQMREFHDRNNLSKYSMLLNKPMQAILVNCTEESLEFSEEGIDGMNFYPDLYWLVKDYGSTFAREKISKLDPTQVETVYFILKQTKVFSFS